MPRLIYLIIALTTYFIPAPSYSNEGSGENKSCSIELLGNYNKYSSIFIDNFTYIRYLLISNSGPVPECRELRENPAEFGIAIRHVKSVIAVNGLDGIVENINFATKTINDKNKSQYHGAAKLNLWISSIAGEMLYDSDPLPNYQYKIAIDKGLDLAGEVMNFQNLEACMLYTIKALAKN